MSRVSREECPLNYWSYPLINGRWYTTVHEFRRIDCIPYTVDSFPSNAKRRRLPPSSSLPRQLTLKKVGRIKRYVCYEATESEFSFFFLFFFCHVRGTWNFARRNEKSVINRQHTCVDNDDRNLYTGRTLVNIDIGSTLWQPENNFDGKYRVTTRGKYNTTFFCFGTMGEI